MFAVISHPECLRHEMGAWHPDTPARIMAIQDHLVATGLDMVLRYLDAPRATVEQLLRVHDTDYLERIQQRSPAAGLVQLDPDTAMNPHTLSAALHAAGAAVLATDMVLSGAVGAAFCNVRPPGHHAERHRAMGFCIFNNAAIAAAHALTHYRLQRVAICDFDVHHGNGTENIFLDDSRVLLCSTFQHPFYPFSGTDTRRGHIINVPMPAGTASACFRTLVQKRWLSALDVFEPQLIIVSAGFDAHRDDDMSQIQLMDHDYAWVTEQIREIALRHAAGRIVSVLEGGYELHALGRSVVAHLRVLMGDA